MSKRPLSRPIALIAAVAAVALLAAPAEAKRVDAGFFGVSAPFVYDPLDQAEREQHMGGIAKLGVGSVRIALSWDEVEPWPPRRGARTYHWDGPDARVALLARYGLRMYPALAYSAGWARELGASKQGPPRAALHEHYAAFAATAAGRYGPGGSFWAENPELPYLPVLVWEVWNEPNLEFFWGGMRPEPKRYAHLLSEALDAIRAVQPGAKVVMGGLAGSAKPNRYVRKVFGEVPSLRKRLDHVGFHPYGGDAKVAFGRLARFREALDKYGRKGIWIEISEDGMSTRADGDRRRYLSRMAASAANSGCHVSRYIVHTWVTPEEQRGEPEHWYGIAGKDAKPKASGRAYRRAIEAVRESRGGRPKQARRIC